MLEATVEARLFARARVEMAAEVKCGYAQDTWMESDTAADARLCWLMSVQKLQSARKNQKSNLVEMGRRWSDSRLAA